MYGTMDSKFIYYRYGSLGALMSMLFIVFPAIITLLCIVKASVIDIEIEEPIRNSLRERRKKRRGETKEEKK